MKTSTGIFIGIAALGILWLANQEPATPPAPHTEDPLHDPGDTNPLDNIQDVEEQDVQNVQNATEVFNESIFSVVQGPRLAGGL